MKPTPGHHQQRAMALVAMLIVLAIMTAAVVKSAASHQLAGRLTSNGQHNDLARLALQQLETLAIGLLLEQANHGTANAEPAPTTISIDSTTVPGGFSSAQIEDMQGRINLNNLAFSPETPSPATVAESAPETAGQPAKPAPVPADLPAQPASAALTTEQLQTLFRNANIKRLFIDRIHDWIDPDKQQRYPDGAEDDYYLRLRPAYRAANQPLADIDELLLLKGMRPALYRNLSPWVAALPEATAININSAPAEVLMALHPEITRRDADQLVALRQQQPYPSVAEFLALELLAGVPVAAEGLTTQSRYFCLHSHIQIEGQQFNTDTLFLVTAGKVTRLTRRYGV